MFRTVLTVAALLAPAAVPVFAADNDTPITPTGKTVLLNGKDFTGWKLFVPKKDYDVTKTWSVKDGIYSCTGRPAGYMRTEQSYKEYKIHVEWRWPGQGGNNGVLLHMSGKDNVWPRSLECQLHSGDAGDFWVIGGLEFKEHKEKQGGRVHGRRTVKLKKSSEKPLGEWNNYDIICKGDTIQVLVNGVLQNEAHELSDTAGKICLQSEGREIEYRNVYIEPLGK